MTIDHSNLTKGQVRKLNALRKSVGDDIAEDAFSKWMTAQTKTPKDARDPVADARSEWRRGGSFISID